MSRREMVELTFRLRRFRRDVDGCFERQAVAYFAAVHVFITVVITIDVRGGGDNVTPFLTS